MLLLQIPAVAEFDVVRFLHGVFPQEKPVEPALFIHAPVDAHRESHGNLRSLVHHGFIFADAVLPQVFIGIHFTDLVLSAFHAYAHEQKKAVFVVTHENDALRYADIVYKMDGGQIILSAGQMK